MSTSPHHIPRILSSPLLSPLSVLRTPPRSTPSYGPARQRYLPRSTISLKNVVDNRQSPGVSTGPSFHYDTYCTLRLRSSLDPRPSPQRPPHPLLSSPSLCS